MATELTSGWGGPGYLDGRWTLRVRYFDFDGGFAYRPNQICIHDSTWQWLTEYDIAGVERADLGHCQLSDEYHLIEHESIDVIRECEALARRGRRGHPNYVVFADASRDGELDVTGNPLYSNPLYSNPLYSNPLYSNGPFGSPTHARPDWATPVYLSPLYADRRHAPFYRDTGRIPTGARPALGNDYTSSTVFKGQEPEPKVLVLDTGLSALDFRPRFLGNLEAGERDIDQPDTDHDLALDPVAGHGTFIAGIIQQLVPGISIRSKRVLSSFGDGDVAHVHKTICDLLESKEIDEYTIVNMSFGGYSVSDMPVLAHVVERLRDCGAVVVASAGNDGIGRPSYPASLPHVIGVGGLGQNGPAQFTNWGPWLRACAPAVDLTSCFFARPRTKTGEDLNSPQAAWPGMPDDLDQYRGWARWTGTSFAAPIIAAALAREMLRTGKGSTAEKAVEAVIDGADLTRLPNLGTIVNLCPPLPSQLLTDTEPAHSAG